MEVAPIFLYILLVWLIGRTLWPAAIPRNKLKMVAIGFVGGIAGVLVGVIPALKVGPAIQGAPVLWAFLGVTIAIFWTGLDPLSQTRKKPSATPNSKKRPRSPS